MEKFVIEGGRPLSGSVNISGSKNSVLPILAAALLIKGKCTIYNVPHLSDVYTMLELLRYYGARIKEGEALEIDCTDIENMPANDKAKNIRASFLLVGALLGRFRKVSMPMPGGCSIGLRPVDLHLKGFCCMGASYSFDKGVISIEYDRLKGNDVYLDFPSVGATENIMLAATLAEGTTVISNCAIEPEIVDLADFLNSAGADIKGAGSDTITIKGTDMLHGVRHTIIPDRIEAGTFMLAAAATGGCCRIENVICDHIKPIILKLREIDAEVKEENNSVIVSSEGRLPNTDIKTMPYPGFPTDMQAIFMSIMAKGIGTGIVNETVFENRFMHVGELARMGADITVQGRTAVVKGVDILKGANVKATDLRAGAGLILSGLCAEGITEIGEIQYIDRGYEKIEEKIRQLGGKIKRVRT